MSSQDSEFPGSIQTATFDVVKRNTANYHPTLWGDHFLTYASDSVTIDATTEQEFEGLKQEVRRILVSTTENDSQKLCLIDDVQRLGVAYHFTKEIEDELQKLYNDDNNLYTVALRFRLLRQEGYYVPCDVFNKFKDDQGKLKEYLLDDVHGMLCLYEAAHLGIRGEDVLDEDLAFTASHLESMASHVTPQLAEQIIRSLNRPIRRNLPRLEAKYYIDIYSGDDSKNQTLLKFAKLDFNMLQVQHQKELSSIIESYCVHYSIQEIKKLVKAYCVEAKWCNERFVPTMEEYMDISLVTIIYPMAAITAFLGMGKIANRDVFEWSSNNNYPKIIKASAFIFRLMDDIVSHEFEQKRQHVVSSIECYMKQHTGVSEEEVIKIFRKEIFNAWKDINQEFLKPTAAPMPILTRILNLSRAVDVIYKDGDGYTNSHVIKHYIESLLLNPFPL
ncbi:hypothetical protein JRO89_XS15G0138700 [Xanthoceras sorbifolium]|uniref:Uncharacterized protein n=1 Tax=Xanthoceras sorbifolium TaxID=99658 RepID=A0ABQ8H240_9ROSI|nr:hypothetical protein JRO89_XS15G0138700 [Xanthoceras sorbifolium]